MFSITIKGSRKMAVLLSRRVKAKPLRKKDFFPTAIKLERGGALMALLFKKKTILMAVPLRPYLPPPQAELPELFIKLKKKKSLMVGPLTPCLNGTAIKKITLLRLP